MKKTYKKPICAVCTALAAIGAAAAGIVAVHKKKPEKIREAQQEAQDNKIYSIDDLSAVNTEKDTENSVCQEPVGQEEKEQQKERQQEQQKEDDRL